MAGGFFAGCNSLNVVSCNNPFSFPWKIPAAWVPALVFGLGILVLLPSVWSETSVTGQDEYWLSFRTPMEMKDRGEWLTPWLNGEPRLRKPPLIYWAILLSYKVFGVQLIAARIWGVLSGAGLAVCACLFSRDLFNRTGLLAGLLALATMGVAVEGRRAMLDLPSALFSALAVLCFVKWLRLPRTATVPALSNLKTPARILSAEAVRTSPECGNERTAPLPERSSEFAGNSVSSITRQPIAERGFLSFILLSAFCLGLSFLTKGPVGFLFFIAGVLACATVFPRGSFLARNWWQLLLGFLMLAAICLPWPLAMQHLWSERFGHILGEELTARQFGHWTPGSPLSAWSGALGLVLPWTPLMLAAIYSHFRRNTSARISEQRFLLAWFLISAVPFFFMKSFERYMLALLPAQIVLVAEWLEAGHGRSSEIILRICVVLLATISLCICSFAWWFKLAGWELVAALTITGFAVFLAFRPTHSQWIAFSCALIFMVALGGIYPRLGINALPENLSAELASYPVELFDPPQPSLLSMRLGRSLQSFDADPTHENPRIPSTGEMVILDAAHEPQFMALMQRRQLHAEQKGRFRTFYSRRAWVRFARPDAKSEDWKMAFRSRSLEGLKSEFSYYLVSERP